MTGSVIVSNTAEKVKVPVGIDSFPLGLSVPFDVYSKSGAGGYSCVIRKWAKFDQAAKDTFKKQGTVFLYIEGDAVKVRQYIENIKTGAPVKPDSGASAYASEKALYHHVSRTLFPAGTEVTFSLFTVDNLRFVPVIAVVDGKAAVITDAVRNSTGDIYIKVPDMPLFREFLSLPSKSVTPQVKATMVKEGVKMSVRDFLSSPSKDQNTDGVVKSANQIIGVLRQKEVPQMEGVYFYQGAWYRSYNGAWYGGPAYNGVWVPVQLQLVPPVIVGVWPEYALFLPLDYYRIHYGDYHSHWRDWEHDRHWNNYGWYKWLTWRPGVLRSGIKWLRNMGTIHGILPYIRA